MTNDQDTAVEKVASMAATLPPHVPLSFSFGRLFQPDTVVSLYSCIGLYSRLYRPVFPTVTWTSESWGFSGADRHKERRFFATCIPVLVLEEAVRQYLLNKHTHYLFFSWLDCSLYFRSTFEKTESEIRGRETAYFSPLKDTDSCLIHWAHEFLILIVFNFLFTPENFIHIYSEICSHLLSVFCLPLYLSFNNTSSQSHTFLSYFLSSSLPPQL